MFRFLKNFQFVLFALIFFFSINLANAQPLDLNGHPFYLKEQFIFWLKRTGQTHFLDNPHGVDSALDYFIRNEAAFSPEVDYIEDYFELLAHFPTTEVFSEDALQAIGVEAQNRWVKTISLESILNQSPLAHLDCQFYFHQVLDPETSTPDEQNLLKLYLEEVLSKEASSHPSDRNFGLSEAQAVWVRRYQPNHSRVQDVCHRILMLQLDPSLFSTGEHLPADSLGNPTEHIDSNSTTSSNQLKSKRRRKTTSEQNSEKKFNCTHAGCTFSSKYRTSLFNHLKLHGEKKFKCTYEGCTYSSSRPDSLADHISTHSGKKPYKCDYPGCNYSCRCSSDLSKHRFKKNHISENKFIGNHLRSTSDTSSKDNLNSSQNTEINTTSFENKRSFYLKEQFIFWLKRTGQSHFLANPHGVGSTLDYFLRNEAAFSPEVDYIEDYFELLAHFPTAQLFSEDALKAIGVEAQNRWVETLPLESILNQSPLAHSDCQFYFHQVLDPENSNLEEQNLLKLYLEEVLSKEASGHPSERNFGLSEAPQRLTESTRQEAHALWMRRYQPNRSRVQDVCHRILMLQLDPSLLSTGEQLPADLLGDPTASDQSITSSGEKKFKCTHPGCTFSSKHEGALSNHLKQHGEKNFRCTHEGCTYASFHKANLQVHIRRHTGEKPYKCGYPGCDYSSVSSSDISTHKKRKKHITENESRGDHLDTTFTTSSVDGLTRLQNTGINTNPFEDKQSFYLKEQFIFWLKRTGQTQFLQNPNGVDSILEYFLRNEAAFSPDVDYIEDYFELLTHFPTAQLFSEDALKAIGVEAQNRWLETIPLESILTQGPLAHLDCQVYFHQVLDPENSNPHEQGILKLYLEEVLSKEASDHQATRNFGSPEITQRLTVSTRQEAHALWMRRYQPNRSRVQDVCHRIFMLQLDPSLLPTGEHLPADLLGDPTDFDHSISGSGEKRNFDEINEQIDSNPAPSSQQPKPKRRRKNNLEQDDEKKYKCTFSGCTFSSKHQGSLSNHQKKHGAKKFQCPHEGCSYSSARKAGFDIHLRTHTGEKPYKCNYPSCDYSSTNISDLSKHKKRKNHTTDNESRGGH